MKNVVVQICKSECIEWIVILWIFKKMDFWQAFDENVGNFFFILLVIILGIFQFMILHAFACAAYTLQISGTQFLQNRVQSSLNWNYEISRYLRKVKITINNCEIVENSIKVCCCIVKRFQIYENHLIAIF